MPAARRSPSLISRVLRIVVRAVVVLVVFSLVWALAYRWINPPTTFLMLRDAVRAIKAKIETAETALIERLDAEGSTKGSGKLATCSISNAEVYNPVDWAKIDAFIKKTGYLHLYQRRLSVDAVREVVEKSGKLVPGTEPFTKRRLNVRSL